MINPLYINAIGHTIGNSRGNSLGVPTSAWLPLDDKCSTGSIVGHAPCQTLPIYASHLSKARKKEFVFVFVLPFYFGFVSQFFLVPHQWQEFPCLFLSFAKNYLKSVCIVFVIIFVPVFSFGLVFVFGFCFPPCSPARPSVYVFLLSKESCNYCLSLYFDLDFCHAPCQTLSIYAFHLSKARKKYCSCPHKTISLSPPSIMEINIKIWNKIE